MDLRFLHTAIAAVAPIDGVKVLSPGQTVQPGWHLVTLPSGTRVVIDYQASATGPQITAGDNAALAYDDSAGGETTRITNAARALAKSLLDKGSDHLAAALRVIVLLTVDELNELRQQVVGVATAVWNPASIASGAGLTSPAVAVAGAAFGDFVLVSAPYTLAGLTATGHVTTPGSVVVRLENQTGAAVDLASGTWKVAVLRLASLPLRTPAQARTTIRNKIDAGLADNQLNGL